MIRLKPIWASAFFIASVSSFASERVFQSFDLPDFTKVSSEYQSDLEIIGGSKHPSIVLSGDPDLFPYVSRSVDNSELMIKAPKGVHVIVKPSVLESVKVVGEGYLSAKGLNRAQNLEVALTGEVSGMIRGPIPIKHLVTVGESDVNLYWLDSDKFLLEMRDKTKVTLSGRCSSGELKLADNATLDARWLRCNELTVQSSNDARANVQAIEGLNAYAGGSSKVFYHSEPRRLTSFSSEYGQVLEALHAHSDH